jgi:hypothetical protein
VKDKLKLFMVIVIAAIIGFSMMACGDNSGGDEGIYGCTYSKVAYNRFNRNDGTVAFVSHYLLTISYDQAVKNITQKLGSGEARDSLPFMAGFQNTDTNPPGVVLEVTTFGGNGIHDIRLVQIPSGGKGYIWYGSDSGSSLPSLEGTWNESWKDDSGLQHDLSYSFSGSNVTGKYSHEGSFSGKVTGTFSHTATTITFKWRDGSTRTQYYALSGHVLWIEQGDDGWWGYFVKQ